MFQAQYSFKHMAICAKALAFRYSSARASVFSLANWQVEAGERLFLHGASGSGKSTLLQLLCGLHAGEGVVKIGGVDLAQLSATKRDRFRARHIGVVFQQFNLIPYLSTLDNVILATSLAGKPYTASRLLAQSLLTEVGMTQQLWQQPAGTLSIGQQQRVAIARALVNTPDLLLLDEPTSALDEANRIQFMNVLSKHLDTHPKTTVIFVSHDTRLASYFDRSIALSDISSVGFTQENSNAN
jgi:putative ABC transport system ATP-binding protein